MKRVFAWLPALCWMAVIFIMSAMPGDVSGEQSGFVMELAMAALDFIKGGWAAANVDTALLELVIRKAAHMAEYAILFACYVRALRFEGARHPRALALVLCAAYACTDEYHQSFTEDRGPSPVDVMIDTAGAAAMWALTAAISRMHRRTKGGEAAIQ